MTPPSRRTIRVIDASGAGVVLALLTVAYFAGVGPYLRAQAGAISERASLLTAQHDERTLLAEQQKIRGEIDAVKGELAANPFTLRPQRELNDTLDSIVATAKEHGLTTSSVEPHPASRVRSFAVTPVTLRGSGRYPDVSRFLAALNEHHRDVRVSALNLAAGIDPAAPPPSFQFELAWYAVPNDSAGVPAGSAPQNP